MQGEEQVGLHARDSPAIEINHAPAGEVFVTRVGSSLLHAPLPGGSTAEFTTIPEVGSALAVAFNSSGSLSK